ncbi:MAG: DUF2254 domain-containing protein [Limisphaerales bacterium]
MKKLRKLWVRIRTSLWFIPSIMVILSGLLAVGLIRLDSELEADLSDKWPHVFGVGTDGVRGILEAIAGSMITVTGVVFSVVIVALSQAAHQYTPRILRNFMRDKGTQIVLGTFVSVFTYCLIVLRTIRSGEEDSFVPDISTATAILLAIISIGVLIYFINHISENLQVSSINQSIADETLSAIKTIYPREKPPQPPFEVSAREKVKIINCKGNGYIQGISPKLADFAASLQVLLRVEKHVGEFATTGEPLISVIGTKQLTEKEEKELDDYFIIAEFRTIDQDPAYGIRQLVDIALKALSPSLNDNATAANCLDHLGSILCCLVQREDPPSVEWKDRQPTVLWTRVNVTTMIEKALVEIRQSAKGNHATTMHMLRIIRSVLRVARKDIYKHRLLQEVYCLAEQTEETITPAADRDQIKSFIRELLAEQEATQTP